MWSMMVSGALRPRRRPRLTLPGLRGLRHPGSRPPGPRAGGPAAAADGPGGDGRVRDLVVTPSAYGRRMGTQNRQRRAAKAAKAQQRAKQRTGRGDQRRPVAQGTGPTGPAAPTRAWRPRPGACCTWPRPSRTRSAATLALDGCAEADPALVDRQAEGELLVGVAVLWDNGWQPAELVRQGRRVDGRVGRLRRRRRSPPTTSIVRRRRCTPAGPPSSHRSSCPPSRPPRAGWPTFARREGLDRRALVGLVVVAPSASLSRAPRLHTIIPPPGASVRSILDADPSVDDPVLVKVRALLAQAESTTFEAEAETFTAKAQELMARHAIDAAMLWASDVARRAADDHPAADRRSVRRHQVAAAAVRGRRTRGAPRCGTASNALSTVVGFASDVASTEMLFTSLLVQSQAALRAEGAKAGPGSRARSRNFRSSFLLSFSPSHRPAAGRDHRRRSSRRPKPRPRPGTGESLLPVLASARRRRAGHRGRAVRRAQLVGRPGRRRCRRVGPRPPGRRPGQAQRRRPRRRHGPAPLVRSRSGHRSPVRPGSGPRAAQAGASAVTERRVASADRPARRLARRPSASSSAISGALCSR